MKRLSPMAKYEFALILKGQYELTEENCGRIV